MIEVIYFEEKEICLCLDTSKKWVIIHNDHIYSLDNNDCILSLLPVLEVDYDHFVQKIKELDILEAFYLTFPMLFLLKYPFDNERVFWAELAMNWIEKDSRINELNNWSKDISLDWMPQKLKHRFFRQFRRTKNQ